jgi:hypothetical protein
MPDLAYYEWSAPEGSDLDDWHTIAQANPGTAVGRITQDFTSVERAAMTDDEFARERLGIFPEHDDAPQWEVVTEEQWEACGTREQVGPDWLGDPPTFAVEFTVDRSAASIGVAGRHPDGGVSVEVIERREGVDWVLDRLIELHGTHNPKAVLLDPKSAASTLVRDLEIAKAANPALSLTFTEVPFVDYARACGSMFDAIVNGDLHHHHQDELDAAVAWAKKRPYGEVWVLDRRSPVDVTPWAVVTLARWGHLEIDDPPRVSIYETRGMEVIG